MMIKVLFFLKIHKKNSKAKNLGLAIWQLLVIIIVSSLISYLILFIQQNHLTPNECKQQHLNKEGWVKCN